MTQRYRVVVADDDADLRGLLRVALERSGRFTVVGEAADGAAAVRDAQQLAPDVVLLDIAMSDTDGLEALPKIHAVAPDAAVVVLSGMDSTRLRPLVEAEGAAGFVPKGLTPQRLVDELLLVLETDAAGGLTVEVDVEQARLHLPASPRSAGESRRFVAATLRDWGVSELFDEVLLLTSELVTNAVVHAGSPVDLWLRLAGGVLRITVSDHSPAEPVLRSAGPEATGGRGLALLDAMATEWGAVPTASGKLVWFEVPAGAVGSAL